MNKESIERSVGRRGSVPRRGRGSLVVLVVLLGAGCTRSERAPQPGAWPAFPSSAGARAGLIAGNTKRPPVAEPEISPESVFSEAERLGWASLPSGETRIHAWLRARLDAAGGDRTAWLLFGTFHDSAGQVDSFRRLVGPGGSGRFTHVVLEQFRADGRWKGLDGDQGGDSRVISEYLRNGDGPAYAALASAHENHDYTAWKYGYSGLILDVLTAARAGGVTALGCDVPDALVQHLGNNEEANRVRELHCLFSFRDAVRPANRTRVAMLWGQAHVGSQGFARFLPADDVVVSVYAMGARASENAPDSMLRQKLVLNDPVLVPLSGDKAAILLPDHFIGGDVDRARVFYVPSEDKINDPVVSARATEDGTLTIGSATLTLGTQEIEIRFPPGAYTYAFATNKGLRVVGSLVLAPRGNVELRLDPGTRFTRIVETRPER